MRRVALALSVIFAAGAGGLLLAGAGLGPAVGAVAGLCLVGAVVTFYGVRTEDLAMFAVGLMVVTVTWNGIRLGGGALGDVFMALAFLAVIAHLIADKRPLPLPPWMFAAAMGFFLAGLLSMIFPPSTKVVERSLVTQMTIRQQDGAYGAAQIPSDLGTLIKYELSFALIPLLIAAIGTTPRRCTRLLNLWTIGAVINAFTGVLDYSGIHLTPVAIAGNRSAGLTVQSNYLALTCVLAIPTAMLWFGRSRRWNLAAIFSVPILLGGLFASGSRAGSVAGTCALVATILLVPRLRPSLRWLIPLGGMALVLVLVFTSTGQKIIHQIRLGSSNSTSGSDYQRSLQASAAWDQIQARPLDGVGFSVIANAHDIYLELLDSGGLIALASFSVFLGGTALAVRRGLLGTQREEVTALAIAITMWLANGVFDNQLADKYLYVVPGLILAFARTAMTRPSEQIVQRPTFETQLVPVPAGAGARAAPVAST